MHSLIINFHTKFEFGLITTFVIPSAIILLLTSLLLTHLLFMLCCQRYSTENSGYQRCKQQLQHQQFQQQGCFSNFASTININSSSIIKLQRIALKSNAIIVLLFATCCVSFLICFNEVKQNHEFNTDLVHIAATIFGFANSLIGLTIFIGFVLLDQKVFYLMNILKKKLLIK